MNLRRLDQRVVPAAAERLRRALEWTARASDDFRERLGTWRARHHLGVPAAPLRRLDDRLTRRGPFALLRELPQLGALVIASLFVAGAGTVLVRSGPPQDGSANRSGGAASGDTATGEAPRSFDRSTRGSHVGPRPGERVSDYVAAARRDLERRSAAAPGAYAYAVVDFTAYQTPPTVVGAVTGLDVVSAYFRVPLPDAPTDVQLVPVRTLAGDLAQAYADVARRRESDADELVRVGESLDPQTAEELEFKKTYLASAASARAEATALRSTCACVFAVVVRAPVGVLSALSVRAAVRVVDPAPQGVGLDELEVTALLPEQTDVVTDVGGTPVGARAAPSGTATPAPPRP